MDQETKNKIEKNRRETSLKAMYFNRFLLVRYMSALFFFSNLYWFFTLVMSRSLALILPLVLMIVILISVAEQVRMYGNHSNQAKYTYYCFLSISTINLLLIPIILFTPLFQYLYPFIVDQSSSRLFVFGILVCGLCISGFILFRLHNIRHDKDWHYKRLQRFENAMN